MKISSATTVFDLAIMFEGNLDTFVKDVMINFNFNKIDDDIAGLIIPPLYTINNNIVNFLYKKNLEVETLDNSQFLEWTSNQGAFDTGFDSGFDI